MIDQIKNELLKKIVKSEKLEISIFVIKETFLNTQRFSFIIANDLENL